MYMKYLKVQHDVSTLCLFLYKNKFFMFFTCREEEEDGSITFFNEII